MKTVSDMYMPVSGEVLEFNEALTTNPEIINKDPYEQGWVVRIKISNPDECSELLSPEQYNAQIQC